MRSFIKSIRSLMGLDVHRGESMVQRLGFFALLIALWALNLFPVQTAQQVLTANALVSSQRFANLQTVARTPAIDSDSIRWIYYQRDFKRVSHSASSKGIEHVVLRLGVDTRATLEGIQKELERLTDTKDTISSPSEQGELRAERWRLATLEHQVALFELDRSREKQSLVEELQEDQAVGAQHSATKARVVNHRSIQSDSIGQESQELVDRTDESSLNQKTWETLQRELEHSKSRISEIQVGIEQSKMRSLGAIALTGSPRIEVISSKASASHAVCVAAFTLFSCVGLVMFLRDSFASRPMEIPRRHLSQSLDDIGIRCLGEIILEGSESIPEHVSDVPHSDVSLQRQRRRIAFVGRLSDGLLLAWLAMFGLRFVSDANWRELLFSAPLSAFSSMAFGV